MHMRSIALACLVTLSMLAGTLIPPRSGLAEPAARPAWPSHPAGTQIIHFSNYDWQVRSDTGGPGPNTWSDSNAWVDANGFLHLKITQSGGSWSCAEINTIQSLGFGTYQFDVVGPIDTLDPNVVLGLFTYPTPDVGPDGTNEIDIEFARWGSPANPNGNYTVWPTVAGNAPTSYTFNFTQTETETIQQFQWMPPSIAFESLPASAQVSAPLGSWLDQPSAPQLSIPQHASPVHMNLWLFQGQAPTDGQEVEIIIKKFTFIPSQQIYLPLLSS